MNKGDFVGGMSVRPLGSTQVMTLGGTPDDWICTWVDNGQTVTKHFQPVELEPAGTTLGSTSQSM
jgi:hypothetical protein